MLAAAAAAVFSCCCCSARWARYSAVWIRFCATREMTVSTSVGRGPNINSNSESSPISVRLTCNKLLPQLYGPGPHHRGREAAAPPVPHVESYGRTLRRWRRGEASHGERTLELPTQVPFLLGSSSWFKLLGLGVGSRTMKIKLNDRHNIIFGGITVV